ncbi:hypothetical protein [uncultured Desulfovibrio sp.]|uniref:hypothetical protein n=1 Tax=uncultured Desulfovibrio sp. TaxID=167968 RepID=UPI002711D2E9|nr:hypothetical protein [uncultured Desulfovibrio sp.]
MSKLWFLDYFCRAVTKSVVRDCCERMELSDLETRLILERFCDRKGMGPCELFYPADQQAEHLPDLDAKVRGWVERNLGRFEPSEIMAMYRFMARKRQATE